MLKKRIIPILLIKDDELVKSTRYKNHNYVGDPINVIKIFNEKEVDELIFLDIDASAQNNEPNYKMIDDIASECFMPLCYGGGIKNLQQMKLVYSLGVEKISISSEAFLNPDLIKDASAIFGNQSVLVTIDVKKDFFGNKKVYIKNGQINTRLDPLSFFKKMEDLGAGEIVINSINNDGVMKGFDLELLKLLKANSKIPVIGMGGAGNIEHIKEAFEISKIDGVACGSMFVYQGPLRGVLISYPEKFSGI